MGRITPRVDMPRAADTLAQAIAQKTYGQEPLSPEALTPFLALHKVLKQAYPLLFSKGEVQTVHGGGLLIFLSGGHSADPLLFLSHLDVVPVDPQTEATWTHPPFSGAQADGYIWGRGAVDMKGHLIGLLEACETLLEAGWHPSRDIWLALACDEEIRGQCAVKMCKILKAQGIRPAFVMDEGGFITQSPWPGMDKNVALIGIGEKGIVNYHVSAKDVGGHASRPPKKTAAARVMKAASRMAHQERTRLSAPVEAMLQAFSPHLPPFQRFITAHPAMCWPFVCHYMKKTPLADALTRTTLAVTTMRGSSATNALPTDAEIVLNCRVIPGDTVKRMTGKLSRRVLDKQVTLTPMVCDDPSAISPVEGPAWDAIVTALSILCPQAVAAPYLMVGGTDARRYEGLSKCIYRISPFALTLAEQDCLHNVNERLSLKNLELAIRFFQQMLQA